MPCVAAWETVRDLFLFIRLRSDEAISTTGAAAVTADVVAKAFGGVADAGFVAANRAKHQ
jgi:hypothetical protein